MHTLFVREHNRLAGDIAAANPGFTDEQIYQEKEEAIEVSLKWEDDALDKVSRIPISFIRNMAVKRIEQEVAKEGKEVITLELFEKYRFTF